MELLPLTFALVFSRKLHECSFPRVSFFLCSPVPENPPHLPIQETKYLWKLVFMRILSSYCIWRGVG